MNNKITKFSAGGIVYSGGKVLTIRWLSKNTIDFPKGIIEPGESSESTCVREVLEETGYKTKIIQPPLGMPRLNLMTKTVSAVKRPWIIFTRIIE